jgi:hypothetical protein
MLRRGGGCMSLKERSLGAFLQEKLLTAESAEFAEKSQPRIRTDFHGFVLLLLIHADPVNLRPEFSSGLAAQKAFNRRDRRIR